MLAKRGFNLCLQVAKNSLLSFRVAPSGRNIMKYFSLRQRLHCLLVGLKLWPLDKIFQDILWGILVFFNPHTWLPRVVLSLFWWLKSWLCSYILFLKVCGQPRVFLCAPIIFHQYYSFINSKQPVVGGILPQQGICWARLYSYSYSRMNRLAWSG